MHDLLAIRQRHPIREVMSVRYGTTFVKRKCKCPFPNHEDAGPSFNIYPHKNERTDRYHCHGCGKQGDVLQLIQDLEGKTTAEAIAILEGNQSPGATVHTLKTKAPPQAQTVQPKFTLVPDHAPKPIAGKPFTAKYVQGKPDTQTPQLVHFYRDAQGNLMNYTLRLPMANGGKRVMPVRWAGEWYWKGYTDDERPPIYGLDRLAKFPELPVLIVEGEKVVDILAALWPEHFVTISWLGGTGQVRNVDWSLLRGRKVVLSPDNDEGGVAAMTHIEAEIKDHVPALYWVEPPQGEKEKGWDLADAVKEMQSDGALRWVRERSRNLLTPPAEDPTSRNDRTSDWLPKGKQLVLTGEGGVKKGDITNLWYVLNHHKKFAGRFSYDMFDQEMMLDDKPLTADAIQDLRAQLTSTPPYLQPSIEHLRDAVGAVALRNRRNRFAEDLRKLRWDGKKRLQPETVHLRKGGKGLLVDYANVEDTRLNRVIGMRWMVGLVRRVLEPGCQHDAILVVEGDQGLRKTSFFRALAKICGRDVYTTLGGALGKDKDDLMKLRGKAIVELAEMTAHRKSDQDTFKDFIDKLIDRYRPPYGRDMVDAPRMIAFCGTTNRVAQYLNDPTGSRRIWPGEAQSKIDAAKLDRKTVEQLWAEAIHLLDQGVQNWLTDEEEAWHDEAVKERESTDPWQEQIERKLRDNAQAELFTYSELWSCLGIVDMRDRTRAGQERINEIMMRLGWVYKQKRMPGGEHRVRGFCKTRHYRTRAR